MHNSGGRLERVIRLYALGQELGLVELKFKARILFEHLLGDRSCAGPASHTRYTDTIAPGAHCRYWAASAQWWCYPTGRSYRQSVTF